MPTKSQKPTWLTLIRKIYKVVAHTMWILAIAKPDFFLRAKLVNRRVLHDHYNHTPCYIEGTLKYNNKPCDWEIRASATGHITCGNDTKYFASDSCDDLFKSSSAP